MTTTPSTDGKGAQLSSLLLPIGRWFPQASQPCWLLRSAVLFHRGEIARCCGRRAFR